MCIWKTKDEWERSTGQTQVLYWSALDDSELCMEVYHSYNSSIVDMHVNYCTVQ